MFTIYWLLNEARLFDLFFAAWTDIGFNGIRCRIHITLYLAIVGQSGHRVFW
jgi:hypothetical protein